MASDIRVAVLSKGHPFDQEAFLAVFDHLDGVTWTHIEHPEAVELVEPAQAAEFDVFVMYDMPGIEFTGRSAEGRDVEPPVRFFDPPPGYQQKFQQLLDDGKGMVFLHHAVAGWPTWPGYADIVGGRFHYQPAELRGVAYPDSGYRHDVTHEIQVVAPDHPVCAGIDPVFSITDEVYLYPVFEDTVVPLLRSSHRFEADGFYSADRAIRGERNSRKGWTHPPGSDLVAWTNSQPNSPVVYLQFGDGPQTYADSNYRKILGNAIRWAADSST